MASKISPIFNLATASVAQLWDTRVGSLPIFGREPILQAEGPALLAKAKALLEAELAVAGVYYLKPRLYYGDEWFSPEGLVAIALPFWLAHPRLASIEDAMMGEVEGGSPQALRRLLRHEAGHCFDHAYGISKRADYRAIFGRRQGPYNPEVYRPDPQSLDFVRHLPGFYAQSDPDEDFAETFAVMITPRSQWEEKYARAPRALMKLKYVRTLIQTHGRTRPLRKSLETSEPYAAIRMRLTLSSYYHLRKAAVTRQRARLADGAMQVSPSKRAAAGP